MNDDYKKLLTSVTTTIDKNYSYCEDMYCNILKCEGDEGGLRHCVYKTTIGAYFPLFDN